MRKSGDSSTKRPGLLRLIFSDVLDVLRREKRANSLAKAKERMKRGDLSPMQELASLSVGEAWLALADFYAEEQPGNPELATEAYRSALQCKGGAGRPARVYEEYDRRRFLGIGTKQDMHALVKEWKNLYFPGYGCEVQLARIHACGPEELRNPNDAWWWVAVAETRWGPCNRLQEKAKEYAYAEFVAGK
jgi:hypothetical protein